MTDKRDLDFTHITQISVAAKLIALYYDDGSVQKKKDSLNIIWSEYRKHMKGRETVKRLIAKTRYKTTACTHKATNTSLTGLKHTRNETCRGKMIEWNYGKAKLHPYYFIAICRHGVFSLVATLVQRCFWYVQCSWTIYCPHVQMWSVRNAIGNSIQIGVSAKFQTKLFEMKLKFC